MSLFETYSHGKLLISGEYFVLFGAKALAVPLKMGQWLRVDQSDNHELSWKSYYKGNEWFHATFDNDLIVIETNHARRAEVIASILKAALLLANRPISSIMGLAIESELEFNPDWGWGSSSTLINNLAKWLGVNPYELSTKTLGGSNYDIACANSNHPVIYNRISQAFEITEATFNPPFADRLFFLFLGKKQDSRVSVSQLLDDIPPTSAQLAQINKLTEMMAVCNDFDHFERLMIEHELTVAALIRLIPVKAQLFSDFTGAIKSLGAWGGDFVMVASHMSKPETLKWFQTKGYPVLFSFDEIVINT